MPTATRALVRAALPLFRLSTREACLRVLLLAAILAVGVFSGISGPAAAPLQDISGWDDLP